MNTRSRPLEPRTRPLEPRTRPLEPRTQSLLSWTSHSKVKGTRYQNQTLHFTSLHLDSIHFTSHLASSFSLSGLYLSSSSSSPSVHQSTPPPSVDSSFVPRSFSRASLLLERAQEGRWCARQGENQKRRKPKIRTRQLMRKGIRVDWNKFDTTSTCVSFYVSHVAFPVLLDDLMLSSSLLIIDTYIKLLHKPTIRIAFKIHCIGLYSSFTAPSTFSLHITSRYFQTLSSFTRQALWLFLERTNVQTVTHTGMEHFHSARFRW